MKNIAQPFKTQLRLLALATGLLLSHTLPAAVTFTNTPATVSNTYNGAITFRVGGLTNGETVVVQEFLDLNANGAIDASDWLVQQFNLTDGQAGMVIGGVTNFNVPGDTDTTGGQITAKLNFENGNFLQTIVGKYLFKLSSPSGHFTPIINSFSVTSPLYGQKFTGNVLSNGTSTLVPYAVVLLTGSGGDHKGPVAGVVANNLGSYTMQAPAGSYGIIAFRSNYVTDFSAAPSVALGGGQTLTNNLTATSATASISGSVVDAGNSNIGLPGVMINPQSSTGLMGIGLTDANGNFNVPVTAGQWKVKADDTTLIVRGYLGLQNGTNVDAGQTNVIIAVPKATALFYGSVKDNLGQPLSGVDVYANDNNHNLYQSDGYSDANGNYVVGVAGGLNNDSWWLSANNAADYLFSQPDFETNGGMDMGVGQVMLGNFTAVVATNTISGTLKDSNGDPIANVGVWANGTINGVQYNLNSVDTDTNGSYSLSVLSGTWTVGVSSGGGGNGNLPGTYVAPQNQTVVVSNKNATANFVAMIAPYAISGYLKDNNGKPIANVNIYANDQSGNNYHAYANTDGSGYYSMGVVGGTWSIGVNSCIDCGSSLPGGYLVPQNQTVVVSQSVTVNFTALLASYTISGNVQQAGGNPIAGVGVSVSDLGDTNYGTYLDTDANGNYSVSVGNGTWSVNLNCGGGASDCLDNILGMGNYVCPDAQTVTISGSSINVNFSVQSQSSSSLQITSVSLPNGTNGVFYSQALQASGGLLPYSWHYSLGSAFVPAGLGLTTNGVISGSPSTNGVFDFTVSVTDAAGGTVDQPLSLTIIQPVLPGSLQVTLMPSTAIGAAWQVDANGIYKKSAATVAGLAVGAHAVSFKPIAGWNTPTNETVVIASGVSTKAVATYTLKEKPTLTILSPKSGTVTSALLTVNGTTKDDVAVASVNYQLNGGGWTLATTGNVYSNWTVANLTLAPGSNTIRFYAGDTCGNISTTNSLSIFYQVMTPLSVTVSGPGKVGSYANNQNLVIGKPYTMTATANAGCKFTGWSGTTNSTSASLKFIMAQGMSLTGNFVDSTKPTISITPLPATKGSNSVVALCGKANDNVAVQSVYYTVNSGPANCVVVTTNGYTNWTAVLILNRGVNVVLFYAQDTSGNISSPASITLNNQASGLAPQSLSGVIMTLDPGSPETVFIGANTYAYVGETNAGVGGYALSQLDANTARFAHEDLTHSAGTGVTTLMFTTTTNGSYTNDDGGSGLFTLGGATGAAPSSLNGTTLLGQGIFAGAFTNHYSYGTFSADGLPVGVVGAGSYTYSLFSPQMALVTETFTNTEALGYTNFVLLDFAGSSNSFYSAATGPTAVASDTGSFLAISPAKAPAGHAPESIAGLTVAATTVHNGQSGSFVAGFDAATFGQFDANTHDNSTEVGSYTYTRNGPNTGLLLLKSLAPPSDIDGNGSILLNFSSPTSATFGDVHNHGAVSASPQAATVPVSLVGRTLNFNSHGTGPAMTFGYETVTVVDRSGDIQTNSYSFGQFGPRVALLQTSDLPPTETNYITLWFSSTNSGNGMRVVVESGAVTNVSNGTFTVK